MLLVAAILGEALSLGAYGLMVKRLLARVGIATEVRPLLGTTVAGVALASSIPAGAAASAVYWYRALRGYGANRGQATHVLVVITLVSIASLAGLVALGAGLAEVGRGARQCRAAILVGVRRARGGTCDPAVGPFVLPPRQSPGSRRSTGLLDCLALYVSLRAVGADVPLRALIATYAIAQIVAVIPLLPGGGGTVEASLVLGFAAFGHTSGSVVAGVVLYRLISNWGLVPIGWAAIALEARRRSPGSSTRRQQHGPYARTANLCSPFRSRAYRQVQLGTAPRFVKRTTMKLFHHNDIDAARPRNLGKVDREPDPRHRPPAAAPPQHAADLPAECRGCRRSRPDRDPLGARRRPGHREAGGHGPIARVPDGRIPLSPLPRRPRGGPTRRARARVGVRRPAASHATKTARDHEVREPVSASARA